MRMKKEKRQRKRERNIHAPPNMPGTLVIKVKKLNKAKSHIQFYLFSTILILACQCQTNNFTLKQTTAHRTNLHTHS